jgi:ectoine hydroxylase-related dioxygenase (phytanoyl-CoA dioxygenase family)
MTQDLSTQHAPVTALFQPDESFRLTDDQVAFFHENGYLAGVKLLEEEQVEAVLKDLPALMDPASPGHELFYEFHSNESPDPSRVLFHALGAWRISPAFHDLLWNSRFIRAAEQLLDGPVRFWHDQLFCKPAHHGGVVAWHQDYSYWTRTQPMAHLTCWIGLDDSTVDNGCVQYVPGSHRWNLLPVTGLAGDMDAIQSVLAPDQRAAFKPVPAEMRRGHASFHHPLMVHGSYENSTPRPRRAFVINVFRDGVVSDSNEPLLEGVPPVPKGSAMGGQFFPRLSH